MFLIDTHTHIYLEEFDADRYEVIERAIASGVDKMLMPNVDESTLSSLLEVTQRWPEYCLPMVGLHPTSVDQSTADTLEWVEAALETGQYVAVGEVGIDLYWDKTHQQRQVELFRYQIGLAVKHQLPLVIHSREATGLILDVLASCESAPKGVLHCFSGTRDEALRAVALGFMLGVGGVFTYKKSNLPEVVRSVGLHHIVLETDAPYLSPVPYRGKRNEPSYTLTIANAVADYLQLPLDVVAAVTTANARKLCSIK